MTTSSLINYVPCTIYYSGGGDGGLVVKSHTALVTPWIITHQAPLSLGFPRGKNTGVGLHFLLQIFPTQESNPCFLHCRWIIFRLSHQDYSNFLN